jgi:cell division protein FtsB
MKSNPDNFQKLVEQYTVYGIIIAIFLMFIGKLLSRRRNDRKEIDGLKQEIDGLKQEMTVTQEKITKMLLFKKEFIEQNLLFIQ